MMEALIKDVQKVLVVSPRSAAQYILKKESLIDYVNTVVLAHPQIVHLVGGNTFNMVRDNHINHAGFMANVFQFNSHEMLVRMIPWVYRTYRAHGFSFDYFPLELEAWKQAVSKFLDRASADEINAVYDWMLTHHEKMIELSQAVLDAPDRYPQLDKERKRFLAYLRAADFKECLLMAREILQREKGQEELYLGVIQPVMYEIGRLWEQDEISVAEEHLATSIVGRILASVYQQLPPLKQTRGRAMVTAAPNEFHELGGRMLADILEREGWDVVFLGANTPAVELMKMLKKIQPRFLAISLTMPFNIDKVAAIISTIRETKDLSPLKVIVGGPVFNLDRELWQRIGADAWAENAQAALLQVNQW